MTRPPRGRHRASMRRVETLAHLLAAVTALALILLALALTPILYLASVIPY